LTLTSAPQLGDNSKSIEAEYLTKPRLDELCNMYACYKDKLRGAYEERSVRRLGFGTPALLSL
jgi:hypothetical protein